MTKLHISFIALLSIFIFSSSAFAQRTYTRELNYKIENNETQIQARANAVNEVKRILSDELGSYIISETKRNVSENNTSFNEQFEQNTRALSVNYMKVKILDEKFTNSNLYLKTEITVDDKHLENKLEETGMGGQTELLQLVFTLLEENNLDATSIHVLQTSNRILSNLSTLENLTTGERIFDVRKNAKGQISDTEAPLNGSFKIIYKDGNYSTFTLNNGLADGAFSLFTAQNIAIEEGNFSKGKYNGLWKSWDIKYGGAMLVQTNEYLNGFKHGEENIYEKFNTLSKKIIYEKDEPKYCYIYDGGYVTEGSLNKLSNRNGEWFSKNKDGNITVKVNYLNGIKNGAYQYFYSNGQTEDEGTYKNDTHVGKRTEYYRSGQIKSEREYNENGKWLGNAIFYFEDGKIREEHTLDNNGIIQFKKYYDNGQLAERNNKIAESRNLNGTCEKFYKNGQQKMECTYNNGKLVGEKTQWYDNSELQKIENYAIIDNASRLNGKVESYNKEGKLTFFYHYKNGIKHGEYNSFYPNQNVKKEAHYVDGKIVGTTIENYENGETKKIENYSLVGSSIKKNGDFKDYSSSGELIKHANYKDGELDGDYFEVNRSRNKTTAHYSMGKLLNKKQVFNDGRIIEETHPYNGKQSTKREFYANGQLKEEVFYKAPKPDSKYPTNTKQGVQSQYFSNGNLKQKRNWDNGKSNGKCLTYREDGKLKSQTIYKNGKKDGVYATFSTDEEILNIGSYLNNKKVNTWYLFKSNNNAKQTIYDEHGNKISTSELTDPKDIELAKKEAKKLLE